MSDSSTIVRDRQSAIRRELDRRGISLKAVAFDAQMSYSSLLSYFPEEGGRVPAMMPVSVLYRLIGVLPHELLSLLLPTGNVVLRVPEGIDHDELEVVCRDYLRAKGEAHHPESPEGRELSDGESKLLDSIAAKLRPVA